MNQSWSVRPAMVITQHMASEWVTFSPDYKTNTTVLPKSYSLNFFHKLVYYIQLGGLKYRYQVESSRIDEKPYFQKKFTGFRKATKRGDSRGPFIQSRGARQIVPWMRLHLEIVLDGATRRTARHNLRFTRFPIKVSIVDGRDSQGFLTGAAGGTGRSSLALVHVASYEGEGTECAPLWLITWGLIGHQKVRNMMKLKAVKFNNTTGVTGS